MGGWRKSSGGKWSQLYLNNNKKMEDLHRRMYKILVDELEEILMNRKILPNSIFKFYEYQ